MLVVLLAFDGRGVLSSVRASGHATGEGGVVCAGASALLRSTARLLDRNSAIDLHSETSGPGDLFFQVLSCPSGKEEWLKGVSDTLVQGLGDLVEEYPQRIDVKIMQSAGVCHGA